MRLAQRRLDGLGRLRAGEDEAEVACQPSGSGTSSWPGCAVIDDVLDAGHAPGRPRAPRTARSTPPRGIGIIITPAAAPLALERVDGPSPSAWRRISSSSVIPVAEAERARAEPADRARRHLDHPRPLARSPAARRGPAPRSGRAPRTPPQRVSAHRRLDVGGQARRRDVDRLLEERAVERIGLVEEGEHVQVAPDAGAPRARPRARARSARRAPRRPRSSAATSGSARIAAIRRKAATNCAGVVGADHAAAGRRGSSA